MDANELKDRQAQAARDRYIITRALFIASRELRKEKHPALADIAAMERLLEHNYPEYKRVLEEAEQHDRQGE